MKSTIVAVAIFLTVILAVSIVVAWIAMMATAIVGTVFDITIFQYISFWEVYILVWLYGVITGFVGSL